MWPRNGMVCREDLVLGRRTFGRVFPAPADHPPFVLVHGLSMSGLYLLPMARALAQQASVYVPDLPGFGNSQKPPYALDIPQLVEALAAWLELMGVTQAVFLGNSFGCEIITEFALQHPQRVLGAVLIAPTPDPYRRSLVEHLLRLLLVGLLEPPSYLPMILYDYLRATPRRTLATSRYILRDPIEYKLGRVTAPTLVVRGSLDPIVSQRWAEQAAALLPCGELLVVKGAKHIVNFTHPQTVCRAAFQFLAKHSLSRP